ncbi:right-handed parallel beta-helix repeat-containing protein [Pilimelia columellifera]|uniref:Right handed beta helix domain-containing protein n=1 Tax=Pilimelia columellifera subsp. columellifera TaxID=706583 RepID=A0ABN3N0X3_9ACTN
MSHTDRRRWIRRGSAAAGLGLLAIPALAGAVTTAELPAAPDASDIEQQAMLVEAEDRRLETLRAVSAAAPRRGNEWRSPYRLDGPDGRTLVLTARSRGYTMRDLAALAPTTVRKLGPAEYLLAEHVYVAHGAVLTLSDKRGLILRLASDADGYASIVSEGSLRITGTETAPAQVTSWGRTTKQPDPRLADGRAYLRATGGSLAISNAGLADLGFGAGRTGGLSLTGGDRPDLGDPTPAKATPADKSGKVPLLAPDERFLTRQSTPSDGEIRHTRITGNAYGLFISGIRGVSVTDSVVANSLDAGVVLHRYVADATIERTVSRDNGGDGFLLAKATHEIAFQRCVAERNGGSGFRLQGQTPPKANPQAVLLAEPVVPHRGGNTVAGSTARDNARHGVELFGGVDITIKDNDITGGDMGIVALQTNGLAVSGNTITAPRRHGISLREGVREAAVTSNNVTGGGNGIYLRDSAARITGNTVERATSHGISLVGQAAGVAIADNTLTVQGPTAVDVSRAVGSVDIGENATQEGTGDMSLVQRARHYASPTTMLWAGVLLIIVATAVAGARRRREVGTHPYARTLPLNLAPPGEIPALGGPARHSAPARRSVEQKRLG